MEMTTHAGTTRTTTEATTTVVVVFTLNRSFYPTTSAVPPVSFLILHPRDKNSVVTVSQKNQTSLIKVGKSSPSVPGTRAQQKKNEKGKCRGYHRVSRTDDAIYMQSQLASQV